MSADAEEEEVDIDVTSVDNLPRIKVEITEAAEFLSDNMWFKPSFM